MKNKVSVIIPVYNGADYLEECLNAVLAQNYSNIEVLVIDDGSTDDTHSIIDRYSKNDQRIKEIATDRCGVSEARNKGLDQASGRYVTFVDADDIPDINLIGKYMDAAEKYGEDAALIMVGMRWLNYRNKIKKKEDHILNDVQGYKPGKSYLLERNKTHYLVWLMLFNFVTNKLYDLEKIKQFEIRFKPNIKNGEDLTFNLDYMKKVSGRYGIVNEPLYRYIKRSDTSLSSLYYEGCIEHTKQIYKELYDFVSIQEGCTEDDRLVIAATGFSDRVSRLTAFYYCNNCGKSRLQRYRAIQKEINSKEFKKTLKEIHKARKISNVRYLVLRTGCFGLFLALRKIYHGIK